MKKLLPLLTLLLTFYSSYTMALSAESIDGATTVNASEAKKLFDSGAAFIDTRRNSDWDAGRIPDAIHLELKTNFTEASLSSEVGKADTIVCYCNGHKCKRAATCSKQAVGWGFTKVHYFRDGFPAWKAAGHPVE